MKKKEPKIKEKKVKAAKPDKKLRRKKIKLIFKELFLLLIGSTLTAIAVKYIYDPAGLVTGGVTGLSIIARSVCSRYFDVDFPLWLGSLVFNVPIFLYALRRLGSKRVLRTAFAWALLTLELFFLPDMSILPDDLLLVAIYGSIIMGTGSGLLLTAHATSGGSDLLGESIHQKVRSVSVGRLIQIIDGFVVAAGLLTFGVEHTLYAVISVFIMGKVIDLVLHQGKSAKMATIISDKNEEIAAEIMKDLDRGVTAVYGSGMYTGKDKKILLCICSKKDLVYIKDIVKKHDPGAFFVVGDVDEAMGEGFLEEWD